jgi:hypothetical protein
MSQIEKYGMSYTPTLLPYQRTELGAEGYIKTIIGKGGKRWESLWSIQDSMFKGMNEITANTSKLFYSASLRCQYAASSFVTRGMRPIIDNFSNIIKNVIDLIVGNNNNEPVNLNTSILNSLWNSQLERETSGLIIDSEWSTSNWSPSQLPLPSYVLDLVQLYSGSSQLYKDTVTVMKTIGISDVETAAKFSKKVIANMRSQFMYTESQLYEAGNYAIVSYISSVIAGPAALTKVSELYVIDDAMPIAQKSLLFAKQRAEYPKISMQNLYVQLSASIYDNNLGMYRIKSILAGILTANIQTTAKEFYVGEFRTFNDIDRFIWGNNGDGLEGKPVFAYATDNRDVVPIGSLVVYERNYIPVTIKMILGWRILALPIKIVCSIWEIAGLLFIDAWYGTWSVQRLNPIEIDYTSQRKFIYVNNNSEIKRSRYTTIRNDYEKYLLQIESERQQLVNNGNSYIGDRMLLSTMSYVISTGQIIYGASNYLILQPFAIIIYNISILLVVLIIGLIIPLVHIVTAWFSAFIYDVDGDQGIFPPVRIVVFELILRTVTLLVISTIRTIWYLIIALFIVIFAGGYDLLLRGYNLFTVSSIGSSINPLVAVATTVKNPTDTLNINRDTVIYYQPPHTWIAKYITLSVSRSLYLTYSSLADAPNTLFAMQNVIVTILENGNIQTDLGWNPLQIVDQALVARRDSELVCKFSELKMQILAEMPSFEQSKIRLNGAYWRGAIGKAEEVVADYRIKSGNNPNRIAMIFGAISDLSQDAIIENTTEPYYEYSDLADSLYKLPEASATTISEFMDYDKFKTISLLIQPVRLL